MTATADTPDEREAKAEKLAREVRRFRWETRVYFLGLILFIVSKEM